jgi:hypothetical protein
MPGVVMREARGCYVGVLPLASPLSKVGPLFYPCRNK